MPGGLFCVIGNPLNDGKWTYTWENGRQLARMQSIDTDAQFVYNENGLRGKKTVNEVVTDYILHGKNIVHMKRGDDELHFFYDAQNRPAVVVYNGTAYAYVKSLQGDIVALLNGAGNVVVSYVYDAWGAPIGKSGSMAETLGSVQPFRYRGYVFDEETGLYYLRSRYYNPWWGRFVNADCIYSANCFAYCGNTPVIFFDEDGMQMSLKIDFDDRAFVTHLMFGGGGGFSYSGRCEDISSGAVIRQRALAYENEWISMGYDSSWDTHTWNTTEATTNSEPFLSEEYWEKHKAPLQSTPNSMLNTTRYNSYTRMWEFSCSYYDDAGRWCIRIDYTNHGREDHGNPHIHMIEYTQTYPFGVTFRLD